MGRIIGIDLGTTNSVVAVADDVRARVLNSKEGKPSIRSIVGLLKKKGKQAGGDPELLVGDVAEDNWEMAPKDTISSVKRLMGRAVSDAEVKKIRQWALYDIVQPSDGTTDSVSVVMGGKEYSPIEISAMILRKIKEDAEMRLNAEVTHAVITTPAYFGQIQKDATRRAGLKAGLVVTQILDEPTAAAIAFGIENQSSEEPKYLLVYDLGGGTFDISVLMWGGNIIAPLNLQGDMWLGGDNFDQVIIEYAVDQIKEEYGVDPTGTPRFMVALRKKARELKERLSASSSATLLLPGMLKDSDGDPLDVRVDLTRDDFERLISPLVDRTLELSQRALHAAGLTKDQVHCVLLAGNATNVPLVQERLRQTFGKDKVFTDIHPKHCVAMGAAVVAARIGEREVACQGPDPSDPRRVCGHMNPATAERCANCKAPLRLEDAPAQAADGDGDSFEIPGGIAAFHYGTKSIGDTFNIFIHKNDPFPTQEPETRTFGTTRVNQRILSIPVYGGENTEKASANEKQGEAIVFLPAGLPANTPVLICLWLDKDCIFELTAHLQDGTDLMPMIVKGGADQRAVEMLEDLERSIHEKKQALTVEELREVEHGRGEVFNKLRGEHFHAALDAAKQLKARVDDMGVKPPSPPTDPLKTRVENACGFAMFIANQYPWALGAEKAYQINQAVEQLQEVAAKDDRKAMTQQVTLLERELNNLPPEVTLLLGMRAAIMGRLAPLDREAGDRFLEELETLEGDFARSPMAAAKKLAEFATRLMAAIAEAERKQPKGAGAKCPSCGVALGGERICPACGEDSWLAGPRSTGGQVITSGLISR
ncbi:MAG: Hsp70 family protein [Acidobacteria bacterium]|nr:Hsp70 family protein [Acidobacteriota bacterium]